MQLNTMSDEQLYQLAAPVWHGMSQASGDIDYQQFSRHFSPSLKDMITQERFESQCREFPLLTSLGAADPVACIRRQEGVTVIFRQLSTQLDGEFIGQLTLSGNQEHYEVINAQVY